MFDEPDNLVLHYLRRIDSKVDRMADDIRGSKQRMSLVEEGLAGVQRRIDRVENRLGRIELRLDLVDLPH